jgi:helix-turn-helix protein
VKHIGDRIQQIDQNIRLRNADAATKGGYTRVPNFVLQSSAISPGAKLAYAMLLRYAWQNDFCFPGQERLAADMGVAKRSVITYLQELEQAKFIEIERRGQGKSNIYELNMLPRRIKTR